MIPSQLVGDASYVHGEKSMHLHRRLLISKDLNQSGSSSAGFFAHPQWDVVFISFAIGLLFLGTICFILWKLAARLRAKGNHEEAVSKPTLFSPLIKSIEDLSFLEKYEGDRPPPFRFIGRGGCGEVYKVDLVTGSNIIPIAIKKIMQSEDEDTILRYRMRQVQSEILTVGNIRHPNLLPLLAHVPRETCHFLVYEYMKNGSLHDALLAAGAGAGKLMWPERHKIAIGVAKGLEYLHFVHQPQIIHRDLKPANILLDEDLGARIADFGLAKIIFGVNSQSLSSNVVGTLGYIAPEYYRTLVCNDKCDIYSFGVILAVLVTGKFPTDRFFEATDEMSIIPWIRNALSSENRAAIIDKNLIGSGFENEMLLALKIACFCTYDDPSQRPNSRDIRYMLSQIKH